MTFVRMSALVFVCGLLILRAPLGSAIFAHRASNGEDIGILILGGIVNAAGQDNVVLLKEIKTGKVAAVKVGGTLVGGLTVTQIARKYIVVENKKGELHLVYLNKFEAQFAKNIPEKQVVRALGEDFVGDGFERHGGKVRMTQAFRDNLIGRDLSKVLMEATAVPQYEAGSIRGFSLTEIIPGSIFEHAGFHEYDLITSINGVSLNNVAATVKLLQGLRNAGSVEVGVIRGGMPIVITASVE